MATLPGYLGRLARNIRISRDSNLGHAIHKLGCILCPRLPHFCSIAISPIWCKMLGNYALQEFLWYRSSLRSLITKIPKFQPSTVVTCSICDTFKDHLNEIFSAPLFLPIWTQNDLKSKKKKIKSLCKVVPQSRVKN